MSTGDGTKTDPASLLSRARDCSGRLYEGLQAQAADLLGHAESAEKSNRPNDCTNPRLSTELDVNVLREGCQRTRRAVDAAARLLAGLTTAPGENDE